MQGIVGICIFAVLSAMLALFFRNHAPHYSLMIGIAAGILIMYFSLEKVVAAILVLQEIIALVGDGKDYFGLLLKILGITYICQFSADVCRDAGYGLVANQIEILGKLAVMISGISVLIEVIRQLGSFG